MDTLSYTTTKQGVFIMSTIFFAVPIGSYFKCNGNLCLKKSSRTAQLVNYSKVFYFGGTERVLLRGQP